MSVLVKKVEQGGIPARCFFSRAIFHVRAKSGGGERRKQEHAGEHFWQLAINYVVVFATEVFLPVR